MKLLLKCGFVFCYLIFSSVLLNAQDWSKVKMSIEEMNNKIEKSMVAGDIEMTTSFYADNTISLPEFEPIIMGMDKIKEKAKKDMMAGNKITAANFKTIEVIGSGDLAVEIGTYDMAMKMAGMGMAMSDKGKYVKVWQKQMDNSWKIRVETWNSDTNPMMKEDMMHTDMKGNMDMKKDDIKKSGDMK